jgi:hypothetical protein
MARWLPLLAALLLAGCGYSVGRPTAMECAPYARQLTGLRLAGDAADWWPQAEGRYARSSVPVPGSVLVFRRSRRLPYGHVSVVSRVLSSRQILANDANWVHGRIITDEPIEDVSPANDWSAVRVWWAPSGQMGITTYPTYGFVGPAAAPPTDQVARLD